MHNENDFPGTPLFSEDDESSFERRMSGPSEGTSRLIGQHLADRQAQGNAPYWPDWDE